MLGDRQSRVGSPWGNGRAMVFFLFCKMNSRAGVQAGVFFLQNERGSIPGHQMGILWRGSKVCTGVLVST